MASQDSNKEANANKRIKMNITMSIEVNKDETGKEYQDIVKNITREAMTRIDAALVGSNSNNNTITNQPTARKITRLEHPECSNSNVNATLNTNTIIENEAMKQIRLRLELKKKSKQKLKDVVNDTTSVVSSPHTSGSCENVLPETKNVKNARVSKRKTNCTTNDDDKDKTKETEAMKRVRQSLELKKNAKQNQNSNAIASTSAILSSPNTSGTCEPVLPETKKAKVSKRKINCTTDDEDKNKSKEIESMKRVRQSLELNKNAKQNQNDNAIPSTSAILSSPSTSGICENVLPETKNVKNARVSKRKTNCTTNDDDKDKTNETDAMKRVRQSLELKKNAKQNQNSNAIASTSAILSSPNTSGTCEPVLPETKKAKVSKRKINCTTDDEDKNKSKETQSMKRVRLSLELKRNAKQNQNDNAIPSTSAILSSPSTSGICENVLPETKKAKGSKRVTKRTTNDEEKAKTNETEAMKRVRQRLELNKKSKQNQNDNDDAATSSTNENVFPGTRNTASSRGTKRKVANLNMEKPLAETDKNKRIKLTEIPNEISSSTDTASEITESYTPRSTNTTTTNIGYGSVTIPNLTPNVLYEMTEDECEISDDNSIISEQTNTDCVENNSIDSRMSSSSSYQASARSVGGAKDAAAASSGRRTRSKTAWERKFWTK